jgi:hypothetical protein
MATQFDWLDSGEGTQADTDTLLIQKLTAELGLDKHEMLAEMARQAEIERGKGILGRLGKDQAQGEGTKGKGTKDGASAGEKGDHARANLIRRIREMKFFSLDETDYKLKRADWLQYVCWQPSVSAEVKRQNNCLSSSDENPVDSLLLSAFEFLDVNEAGAANKILEDAATAHVRKVRGYLTELSEKTPKAPHAQREAAVESILRQAALRQESNTEATSKGDRPDEPQQYNQAKVEEYLQNADPLKQNLVKSYYTLRLLRSRECKTKMIQALNFFRGVQKRLAHDVREFYSRERALGGQKVEETLVGPQFGKDEHGNLKAKKCGTQGPGNVNANRINRDLEGGDHTLIGPDGEPRSDPISLKGYKFNKCFNPLLSSTCPCLPRFHTTFGRPSLYEEVSQEFERKGHVGGGWRHEARPIVAYKDRLVFKAHSENVLDCEIAVLDEHGIRVVYEEALNDMLQLEEEMMKVGSHFLNKAEML